MFLFIYLAGWFYRMRWRFGWMTRGTAPSFKTAWWAYGFTGIRWKAQWRRYRRLIRFSGGNWKVW